MSEQLSSSGMFFSPDYTAFDHWQRGAMNATEVANAIVHAGVPESSDTFPLIYGVWVRGDAVPIYIGQSTDGRRRLWDLAIGESHHLANSFSPDLWSQVIVVRWREWLGRDADAPLRRIRKSEELSLPKAEKLMGLALEFALHSEFRPLFNCHKKSREGTLLEIDHKKSKSQGALAQDYIGHLHERLFALWEQVIRGDDKALPPAVALIRLDGE